MANKKDTIDAFLDEAAAEIEPKQTSVRFEKDMGTTFGPQEEIVSMHSKVSKKKRNRKVRRTKKITIFANAKFGDIITSLKINKQIIGKVHKENNN